MLATKCGNYFSPTERFSSCPIFSGQGRVAERGGLFFEFRRGIPIGCPLSLLLGAFFLGELDARLEKTGSSGRIILEPPKLGLTGQNPVALPSGHKDNNEHIEASGTRSAYEILDLTIR
jgi:hypothetical protein